MSKSKLAGVLVAGLLLSTGAAHAASVFPTAANEVSPSGLTQSIEGLATSATLPLVPAAAYEHGPFHDVRVTVRSTGARPSLAGMISPFPSAARETGSSL
jgi:hypothetical protein